jgi:hypothetical protein
MAAALRLQRNSPTSFALSARAKHPERFTIQHLKDLGFTSTNHRAFIPLLTALGFFSPDVRYHEYRNEA